MFFDSGYTLTLGRKWLLPAQLRQKDRGHIYLAGGSGTGKTSELYNLILQDIKAKRGVGVIDVHGDLTEDLEKAIYRLLPEEEKRRRVVILDPTRGSFGFNPLEVAEGEDPYPSILELQSVFKKLWEEAWGERMGDILRNVNLVMAEKNLTMCQIPRFLTDPGVRRYLIKDLKNQGAKEYWKKRFGKLPKREKSTWIESSLNKINQFISDPIIRRVVGQRHSTVDFRRIMDNSQGSILLIRLPKGRIKENVYLLGALLISKIQEAALSRVELPQNERRKFFLYIDEFQNFGTKSLNFETILSESRKYALSLVLAHQNLDQIDLELLASILGNTSCQIIFRISRRDGEILGKEVFKIDLDDLEWRRDNGRSYLTLPEQWEDNFNSLTSLKKRQAYAVIKGARAQFIRTIDKESYQATPNQLNQQAGQIMAPYTRSAEEIRREEAQLMKELEPNPPKFKG